MKRFQDWLRNAFIVIYFLSFAAIIVSLEIIFKIYIWSMIGRYYDVVVALFLFNIIVVAIIGILLIVFRR